MPVFVLVVLGVAGLLAAVGIALRIWRQYWIETTGRITQSTVRFGRGEDKKVTKAFVIRYSFYAQGEWIEGEHDIPIAADYHVERDVVQELATEYKVGQPISVFHSESLPVFNALRRSVGLDQFFYSLGVLVLLLLGYYLYFVLAYQS